MKRVLILVVLFASCTEKDTKQSNEHMLKNEKNTEVTFDTSSYYNDILNSIRSDIPNNIIDVVEIENYISDHMNYKLDGKFEIEIDLFAKDSIANRSIIDLYNFLIKKYKIKNIALWFKNKNKKSIFNGISIVFDYSKKHHYRITLSLKPSDYIFLDEIVSEIDFKLFNVDLMKKIMAKILTLKFKDIQQYLMHSSLY